MRIPIRVAEFVMLSMVLDPSVARILRRDFFHIYQRGWLVKGGNSNPEDKSQL